MVFLSFFFSQLCYFVHVLYLYMWGYNFNLIFVGLRSRRPPPTSTSLLQLQLPPVPTTTRKVTWQRSCLGWGLFDRYYEGPPPTYRGREESRSRWASTFSVTNFLWWLSDDQRSDYLIIYFSAGLIITERWMNFCAEQLTGHGKGENLLFLGDYNKF